MNSEVFYQCKVCNYVLRPNKEDPKPSYCPNCALHNHKGEMILVGETVNRRQDPEIKIYKE